MANKIFLKSGAWYKASKKSLSSDIELSILVKNLAERYPDIKEPYVPVKIYTSLLTQNITNVPTAIILENTLGIVPPLDRLSVGVFSIDLSSVDATPENTFAICGSTNTAFSEIDGSVRVQIEGNILYIVSRSAAGTVADGVMSRVPIEIRIYS